MKVFLVPLGASRHLPYCEPRDGDDGPSDDGRGLVASAVGKFREVLHLAERHRLDPEVRAANSRGWGGRLKSWALGWLADRIAEQRLLWQLRGLHAATLIYPADLSEADARRQLLDELRRDGDRHRRWLVVDAALLVASGVLAVVPGPNLIAYYFAFRVVGHFLSMRGARQGLNHVEWASQASPELRDLRLALSLDPGSRRRQMQDLAARLDLAHLVSFVERVAPRGA